MPGEKQLGGLQGDPPAPRQWPGAEGRRGAARPVGGAITLAPLRAVPRPRGRIAASGAGAGAGAIARVTGLSAQNPATRSPAPSAPKNPESHKSTVAQTTLSARLTAGLCSAGSPAFVTRLQQSDGAEAGGRNSPTSQLVLTFLPFPFLPRFNAGVAARPPCRE